MSAAVHVSGRGAVTAFGAGREAFLSSIFRGESAVAPLRRLAGTDCLTSVAAEVPETMVEAAGGENGLALWLATRAAREAMAEAEVRDAGGLSLVLATTKGDLSGVCGPGDGLGNPYSIARRLAGTLGIGGRVAAVSCACASGLSGIALAGRWMRAGLAERVLVVGADGLSAFILRGFSGLLALDPEACRPFDGTRAGLSLGEAAGAMVLTVHAGETLGYEVAGWGESNDANHITGPRRDGSGLRLAIERALAQAGLGPDAVDYVHLHGTGTPYNDAMEGEALLQLYPAGTPPASGTKGQTGHTLGAAGLIESLVALEALSRARAPANHGLEKSDLDGRIDLAGAPVGLERAETALKIAAGFGGINVAVVFRRAPA
jgi:3-oxoacyl-(acyl-carrier-protein) synthase